LRDIMVGSVKFRGRVLVVVAEPVAEIVASGLGVMPATGSISPCR